ncbi:MAG: acetyl-CoA carboxylase biotin carboxyl carrier protein [Butyricicoccaceae bacterium]
MTSRLRSKRPLRRPSSQLHATAAAAPAASAAPAAAASSGDRNAHRRRIVPAGTQVKSPLVGTFYSAPSPDEPPFVLVGQEVKEGDTLCIIEAMKVMNEIKAPCSGKVVRIMVQPGDMVEYNQLLCIIE